MNICFDIGNEVHHSQTTLIATLIADKASIKVSSKYTDFVEVFLPKLAIELLQYMGINNYSIELVDDQQPSYSPIYSLGLVEFETFKAYIKNNPANCFIRPSKLPAGASIFFNKKPDRSLRLCVDNQNLNNLTIKNRYLLPLVGKSLDQFGPA